jgi:predicted Rossmann fold flavoprotein
MIYDVIIVGGGAAGLMCYHQLAETNLKILLLEKNASLGKKLLLTGNGRCNVTNKYEPKRFMEELEGRQKKFFYKAIHHFSSTDIVAFFEERGVPLKLENNFQYFPVSNKAQDILQVLTSNMDPSSVHLKEKLTSLQYKDHHYYLQTNQNNYQTKNLIIATGSKSFPKTGSTGDGLIFAEKLGIKYFPFYPAETKVYAKEIEDLPIQGTQLSMVQVHLLHSKIKKKGDLLFTHDGLSGPVIYHMSEHIHHHLQEGKEAKLSIDLLNTSFADFLVYLQENRQKTLETILAKYTSKRFASVLFKQFELPKKQIQDLKKDSFERVYQLFTDFQVRIDKVEDVTKAYVNGGGVFTKELHPSTMESKQYKGLYFIGETMDLHGPIGGFNLTIAFASAFMAAKHIKEKSTKNKDVS